MLKVSFDEMYSELRRVLLGLGFREDRAERCAQMFTEASCDGVYSHGLNRFPRFVGMIENGAVDIHAEPERVGGIGVLERWEGNRGPGNLNAYACMNRALELAHRYGMGGVALRHTNHWMRGGTYGWQAADAGMIGMCWTNTNQNMPPWGAREARIGNNPLVLAVPRSKGAVVLDMALAQFSYGALASYRRRGEPLPVVGGYDADGELTRDPAAIEQTWRPLPIGFWKGSGLSILLDLMAAMLSGGQATREISSDPMQETGLSQVFLAFNVHRLGGPDEAERIADAVIDHLHGAEPATEDGRVRYPGERTLEIRRDNLDTGIPVDPSIWQTVQAL